MIMDQVSGFMNSYPFLWMAYPIVLVLPFAVVIAALVPLCVKTRTNSDPSVVSSNDGSYPHKMVNSEQSDGHLNNQKRKSKVRYLVRGAHSEDDKTETENDNLHDDDIQKWNFPPVLEEFNLMDLDADPSAIEELLADRRLIQVVVRLNSGQGLGLTIVGGTDSANGAAPIYIKRILGDSVLQNEGKLKAGDELIAVNDILLVNATKEHASEVLSSVEGAVRVLAIQDL